MCRESSFWVTQPKTLKVFTNKVFTVLAVSFLLISVAGFTFCYITEAQQEGENFKI